MVVAYIENYITTILVALIGLFLLPSLIINIFIHIICIKYKIKVKFKFKRFHHLTNVEIHKLKDNEASDKLFEIFIDKIWISSCYLNHAVNDRVVISVNNIRVLYNIENSNPNESLTEDFSNINATRTSFFLINWLIQFYLKYIGSLNIDLANIKLLNVFKNFQISLNLSSFGIEFKENILLIPIKSDTCTEARDQNEGNELSDKMKKRSQNDHVSILDYAQNKIASNFYNVKFENFNLKALKVNARNTKYSKDNIELLSELNIQKTSLRVFVNEVDSNYSEHEHRSIKTRQSKIEILLNTIDCVQVAFENTQCVFNKLIDSHEKSYFRNFKFLIEHLNTTSESSKSDKVLSSVFNKIHLVVIKDFLSKFILDASKMKYEKIKIDEIKFMNSWNLKDKPHDDDLIQFLVKKVDYSTDSRQKYSLLNRFSVSLNQSKPNRYNLATSCENANVYFHINFIRNFLHSKFFNTFIDEYKTKPNNPSRFAKFQIKDKILIFNFRILESYFHLINIPEDLLDPILNSIPSVRKPFVKKPQLKTHKAVYSLGMNLLNVNYQKSRNNDQFVLDIKRPILFKSTLTQNLSKFVNNLFEKNNDSNLNGLFSFINNGHKQRHYWGNLVSLDSFRLKFQASQFKTNISLIFDTINIEHSLDALHLIDFLVELYNKHMPLENTQTYFSQKSSLKPMQIKINVKSFNYFLLFRQQYLLVLQLENFNLVKINHVNNSAIDTDANGFNLTLSNLACVQFKIDDDILIFQQQATEESTSSNSSNENSIEMFDDTSPTKPSPIQITKNAQLLNYCFIENFLDNKDIMSNFNLILLIKEVRSNTYLQCELENDAESLYHYHCITINDIICTWSLQIHYILYESLIKPGNELKQKFIHRFGELNESDKIDPIKFKVNVLVESDILINFLFDYSQDSSKDECKVENSPVSCYQTVSIILYDTFLSLSNIYDARLNINEITMFVNADDQNIFSNPTKSSTDSKSEFNDLNGEENVEQNQSIENLSMENYQQPNKHQFFYAKNFVMSIITNDPTLEYEREMLKTAVNLNTLMAFKFDIFKVNFIHDYNFAKLIDHVLNLKKCLVKIHAYSRDPNSTILSWDLQIHIKKFRLVIEDDPFEIKLAYNYALMHDEHLESVKRRKQLEQRRLIKEQHLEKEALEILNEKESLIYLKRSKQIYKPCVAESQRTIRKELFCFSADNFDFYALCDTEWHGRQKCYNMLRKIDKESPPPPTSGPNRNPADHYRILWCRYINITTNELKFNFRDYTQSLMKINMLHLFGHVLGSEYEPSPRAKREVKIGLGINQLSDKLNTEFEIFRNMSPFKIHHDFCSKMSFFSCAYGPCWEGSMAQLNLCLDKIIHPPRDPSRPMPWWDKSRLYLHGRFTSQVSQAQIIYHVSMDPYNRTEEMKWVFTQLYFDWTNMLLVFKGALDIFLNTESKYDDCRLLHLPNLELKIKIEWICKSQYSSGQESDINLANLHNFVVPCAPDKLPIIVNSSEHDSYSQFRSENLNISLSFVISKFESSQSYSNETQTIKKTNDNGEENIVPTCKFYASTSRFLERIKTLLSTITRPTRRGKLFKNFKPRKPILSRHFKLVNVHFEIPKLNIIYWSSASEEYGCLLECEQFNLDSTHKLELIPWLDSLKRRPRPCWYIEIMKCKLAQTKIYLMAPNSGSGKFNNDLSKNNPSSMQNDLLFNGSKFLESHVMRSFFMQIDSIFYEREKNCNYNIYNCSTIKNNEFNQESFEIPSNGRKSSSKRQSRYLVKNIETSSSSSESQSIQMKQRQKFKRPHSVKQPIKLPLDQNHYNHRSSLRSKNKQRVSNENNFYEARKKSNSLLIGGNGPSKTSTAHLYMNKERIGSADSLLLPNTAGSTLTNVSMTSLIPFQVTNMPKHNIQVRNLKAKWNNVNRDVIFILYEIYNKAKRLRYNLSTQALKQYDVLTDQIVQSFATNQTHLLNQSVNNLNNTTNSTNYQRQGSLHTGTSGLSHKSRTMSQKISPIPTFNVENEADPQKQFFEELLNKLDYERDIKSDVYCDEKPVVESSNYNDCLYGVHAASKMSDIVNENIFIEFINSQVKLSLEEDPNQQILNNTSGSNSNNPNPKMDSKNLRSSKKSAQSQSTESTYESGTQSEYLIISAAKANVVQRVHKPVWKSQRLLDKTSWSGNLEKMQYFATLNYFNPSASSTVFEEGSDDLLIGMDNKAKSTSHAKDEDEYWLTDDIIDVQINSPTQSNSPHSLSSPIKNSKQTELEFDNMSSISDPSLNPSLNAMNEHDVISSSSSTNLNKINKNQNNLGMLIPFNINNMDRQSNMKIERLLTVPKTPKLEPTDLEKPQQKKRFQNIRNGLTKSNRKLTKPDLLTMPSSESEPMPQKTSHLQLIVSKCRCEFYMIDFEDKIGDDDEHLTNQVRSNNLITGLSTSPTPQLVQNSVNPTSNLNNSTLNYSQIFSNLNQSSVIPDKSNSSSEPSNQQIDLNATFKEPMDCISLIHYDLDLCTNSQQYKMIMNLVNNLVLYFRPRRKQIMDKQKSIKFNLQLSSSGDLESLIKHIKLKQIEAKELLCNIRAMERRLYHLRERIQSDMNDYSLKYGAENFDNTQIYAIQELKLENKSMEKEYREFKRQLNELSDELNISVSCYKELMLEKRAFNLANTPQFVQHILYNNNTNGISNGSPQPFCMSQNQAFYYNTLNLNKDLSMSTSNLYLSKLINNGIQQTHLIEKANRENENSESLKLDLDQQAQQSILNNEIGRRYEIWFKQTRWQLNDEDGQTCCAQFLMKNILYTKVSNQQELDCVEHTLEIESCKVQDLSEQAVSNSSQKSNNKTTTPSKESARIKKHQKQNLKSFVLKGLFDNVNQEVPFIGDNLSNYENPELISTGLENQPNTNFSTDLVMNSGTMIRVYFKERPPVGCIPVIDHLELNVSPLSINLTNSFYKMMMKFFFENQANQTNQNNTASSSSISANMNSSNNVQQMNNMYVDRLQIPTRSANSTLRRNYQSFHGFNNEDFMANQANFQDTSSKINNQIQIVLQSPTTYRNLLNKKSSQSSLLYNESLKTSNSVIINNNLINIDSEIEAKNNQNNSNNSLNNPQSNAGNNSAANNQMKHDDIEIMKQRSANNNTFLCIKIPEIQLLVSYRATSKDKNIKDLKDVSLLFPLFEVHDKTWTWLDLINALKSHVKKALVSQAIRHKLIKVPIQPVNKLLSRVGRSQSSQHLTNLEIDENEKLTILKLFGTKFIEKNSSNLSPTIQNMNEDQTDSANRRNSLIDITDFEVDKNQSDKSSNKSLMAMSSTVNSAKKTRISKSNTTVGLNLKKHLLKFSKDKNEKPNKKSARKSVDSEDESMK